MRTEEEIRKRLDEITDFICIIGRQQQAMVARAELLWVLGEEPNINDSEDLYGDGLRNYIQTHGRLPQMWYDNQEAVSKFTE